MIIPSRDNEISRDAKTLETQSSNQLTLDALAVIGK